MNTILQYFISLDFLNLTGTTSYFLIFISLFIYLGGLYPFILSSTIALLIVIIVNRFGVNKPIPIPSQTAVLITGCSSGIGYNTALSLSLQGIHVIATVRKHSDAQLLTTAISPIAKGSITPIIMDVTDTESIYNAVSYVKEYLYTNNYTLLSIINNAGYAHNSFLESTPLFNFIKQYNTNVFGSISVTNAFLPLLRQSIYQITTLTNNKLKPSVIFIGSMSGRHPFPVMGPYTSSKHAIESIADVYRAELRPQNINVILFEPGMVQTSIINNLEISTIAPQQHLQQQSQRQSQSQQSPQEQLQDQVQPQTTSLEKLSPEQLTVADDISPLDQILPTTTLPVDNIANITADVITDRITSQNDSTMHNIEDYNSEDSTKYDISSTSDNETSISDSEMTKIKTPPILDTPSVSDSILGDNISNSNNDVNNNDEDNQSHNNTTQASHQGQEQQEEEQQPIYSEPIFEAYNKAMANTVEIYTNHIHAAPVANVVATITEALFTPQPLAVYVSGYDAQFSLRFIKLIPRTWIDMYIFMMAPGYWSLAKEAINKQILKQKEIYYNNKKDNKCKNE